MAAWKRKALLILFLALNTINCCSAATVQSTTIDPKVLKELQALFGTPDKPAVQVTNTKQPQANTTVKPTDDFRLDPNIGTNNSECLLKDGSTGVCVLHYQCDSKTQEVIDDGRTLIDIRQRECPHYLEVCCRKELTKEGRPPPPKVEPSPECGWGNPGAQAYRLSDADRTDFKSADFGEYPWMVALLKKSDAGGTWAQGDFLGGGSIIHPSVVLTAAHKVENYEANQLKCRGGEWDTQTDREVYPYQDRDVRKVIIHEDYYRPSVYFSVALLILDKPYDLSESPHMGVACIGAQAPLPDTKCETMGWGKQPKNANTYVNILKKVELPLRSRKMCENALRGTRLGTHFKLHASLTCAGGEKGVDTCTGDGGSSLVCPIGKESGRYAIFGMSAWGIGCGEEGIPGVYVNVPHVRRWIDTQMGQEGFQISVYSDPKIPELRP